MTNTTGSQIAKAAGISSRTKRFQFSDESGNAYRGNSAELVLAALSRSDQTPDIDFRTRVVVQGIRKCYATGRMNVDLVRHIREDLSPYQVCKFVAHVANTYPGEPTIGHLADFWINQHAAALRTA